MWNHLQNKTNKNKNTTNLGVLKQVCYFSYYGLWQLSAGGLTLACLPLVEIFIAQNVSMATDWETESTSHIIYVRRHLPKNAAQFLSRKKTKWRVTLVLKRPPVHGSNALVSHNESDGCFTNQSAALSVLSAKGKITAGGSRENKERPAMNRHCSRIPNSHPALTVRDCCTYSCEVDGPKYKRS